MPSPRRRWSFGLRTMLVLVSLLCCWLGYQVNWIRERHRFAASAVYCSPPDVYPTTAPIGLRLFGESGHYAVFVLKRVEAVEAARLFPEAEIICNEDYLAAEMAP